MSISYGTTSVRKINSYDDESCSVGYAENQIEELPEECELEAEIKLQKLKEREQELLFQLEKSKSES